MSKKACLANQQADLRVWDLLWNAGTQLQLRFLPTFALRMCLLSKLALSRSKTDDQQKCHACYHIALQVMQIILEQLFWSLAALTMLFFKSKRGRGLHWQHEFTARGAGLWLLSTRQ